MSWSSSSTDTILTLVRHGQASYLDGATYDRLSEIGKEQAFRLGEYWAKWNIRFDSVFSGPAERHRHTAEIVAKEASRGGQAWPEPIILPEFDEFPGEEVVRTLTPMLMEQHAHIRQLAEAFEGATDKEDKKRALDRLFHEVAGRWADGEVSSPKVESWEQFVARVRSAANRVREQVNNGRRAVVFTSAGPTAVVTSMALETSPRKTLDLAFSPRNASYSEFRLSGNRVSLNTFNAYPHLSDSKLLTHR